MIPSLLHALPTCEDTTHNKRQSRLCNALDPSSPRRLLSPSRDNRFPPHTQQSRVLYTLHANPCWWLLNGYSQPPLSHSHKFTTTKASTMREYTHLECHIVHSPRWTHIEHRQAPIASPADMTLGKLSRNGLSSSLGGNTSTLFTGGELKVKVYEWCWFWFWGVRP